MLIPVLIVLVVLQLVCLAVLLLRRQAAPPVADPRQAQLPDQLLRLDARAEASDKQLHSGLAGMRAEIAAEAQRSRAAASADFGALRTEITGSVATLGAALNGGLAEFRKDNAASAETLRTAVHAELTGIGQRLQSFIGAVNQRQLEDREALNAKLNELTAANAQHQERLRTSVGESLAKLNTDNAAKLEEMRATVDEKLHATLHTRLTESFGQVTDQLNKVHTGLGEMSKLSEGVDGLSRIFTNVKSRGGFAEVQLGMLLKQMLAPGQYIENATVKPGSAERVEFAIRFPSGAGERLMPIDAKFPREAWERLEAAYESNLPDAIAREGRAFENAIRTEADRICGKYIHPPVTTPYGIMFLPTEGLYAEVIRRGELQSAIQSQCHVTIAGPTTLSAILTSFQMGFHMLALQEKGDEVWKVLEGAKNEFGKFGKLMDKVEGDVGKIQKTLGEVGVRTRAINRTLREVSSSDESTPFLVEDLPGIALAASGVEEQ
ncbi:DNA recombination protein RmuC [Granulicella rosea]|uniref:DNA recombination protein RmuC n=1 Tax=Granulicella rosea TaxID=474952 RepID=A0A239LU70_9BACT|nr:DNA recombination protein RmuC [Granulicella rosea]SNT33239.1 DNA recombination protein RmuC [Granulicella rosea]